MVEDSQAWPNFSTELEVIPNSQDVFSRLQNYLLPKDAEKIKNRNTFR